MFVVLKMLFFFNFLPKILFHLFESLLKRIYVKESLLIFLKNFVCINKILNRVGKVMWIGFFAQVVISLRLYGLLFAHWMPGFSNALKSNSGYFTLV